MAITFDITEEQVNEAIKAVVAGEVNLLFERYEIRDIAKTEIAKCVDRAFESEIGSRFDEIVSETLDEHLSQPFELDDGWGYNRQRFETYSDFIRFKLHEKFGKEDYRVKNEFQKRVQAKVDEAWNQYKDDAIAIVTAKVGALGKVD